MGSAQNRSLAWRLAIAFGLALGIGLLIEVPVRVALEWQPFGFWGLFYGSVAAIVTFGIAFSVLSRRSPRAALVGRWIAGLCLGVFAYLIAFATMGTPLFSLEGAWIYPLILVAVIGAILLLMPRRLKKPSIWDAPPSR
jgi:hypothetical protein